MGGLRVWGGGRGRGRKGEGKEGGRTHNDVACAEWLDSLALVLGDTRERLRLSRPQAMHLLMLLSNDWIAFCLHML